MSAHNPVDLSSADGIIAKARQRAPVDADIDADIKPASRKASRKQPWVELLGRCVHEHPIEQQESFLRTLSLERKRSERSENPFLLLLLKSQSAFKGVEGQRVIRQFEREVFSVIRDIDAAGWYEDEVCLGVIFGMLSEADADAAAIVHRLTAAMSSNLSRETVSLIRVSSHLFPESGNSGLGGNHSIHFYPDLPVARTGRRIAHVLKRGIDILGSLLALAILLPVFLVIAALIKLTSAGPVFFRQTRVGQYGTPFTFLKFRSMFVGNDSSLHQQYVTKFIAGGQDLSGIRVFKIEEDPRVTRIGRILRRTSLDELPQFLNVLRGEMSLVGPRPPLPYEVEKYDLWHRRRILEVKPGITGLWQVTGRSRVTFEEMVRLDLKYARKWTIAMDLKILCLTPKAMISGDGAY